MFSLTIIMLVSLLPFPLLGMMVLVDRLRSTRGVKDEVSVSEASLRVGLRLP